MGEEGKEKSFFGKEKKGRAPILTIAKRKRERKKKGEKKDT